MSDMLLRSGYDNSLYTTSLPPTISGATPWSGFGAGGVDSSFTLSLPNRGDTPLYMFTLGTSIWSCVGEIAKVTGWWYFFHPIDGMFHYCPPFTSSNSTVYQEIAQGTSITQYNEMYALTELKDVTDFRNGVIVEGMDMTQDVPAPIAQVYKTDLTNTASTNIFNTVSAGGSSAVMGYVPWYRWTIIPDAKLNTPGTVQWVANRTFSNLTRPHITGQFKSFGNPTLYPLDIILLNLNNDTIGLPPTSQFRILGMTDTVEMSAEHSCYESRFELEWHDDQLSKGAWWDSGNQGA